MSATTGELTVPVRQIVGNQEVRAMCGRKMHGKRSATVTRLTLLRWRETAGFPAPIRTLGCGELWDAREVRAWLRDRQTSS